MGETPSPLPAEAPSLASQCTRRPGARDTACRCSDECRALSTAARRARGRRHDTGRPGRIPAEPVARHLRRLLAVEGASTATIARATGVSRRALSLILAAPVGRTVNATTAQKVLSVGPVSRLNPALSPTDLVDATGTRRRVEALIAAGWPSTRQAGLLSLSPSTLAPSNLTEFVHRCTAESVAGMYDALWRQPGPSTRSRSYARRFGFAPSWAWDRNIDDPRAVPDVGDFDPEWRWAIKQRATRLARGKEPSAVPREVAG